MARKTLGFIPLIWQCPSCNTQNPGPIKSCTSCGAPQPVDIKFKQVNNETFNFIKDEALIREAKAGPNVHCPYCGTRNPATAELCSNCGGELRMGGKARQAGQRVPSITEPDTPPTSAPPAAAAQPKKARSRAFTIFAIIGAVACLAAIIFLVILLTSTDDVTATVTGVAWERSIAIEAYTTVTDRDWLDEIPAGADVLSCTDTYRYTSDTPQPNATEVCGEPYVEDTGTGVGEVVQDCSYEVYDDYCEYTAMQWVIVETVTETGDDLSPVWPLTTLSEGQREGLREENYRIVFSGDGERYTYTTTDSNLFMQARPGSRWNLAVNSLGGIQSIEPAN